MRHISTSNGWRSRASVEAGFRPRASETCFPAPQNFPLGEDQISSGKSFVLTLRIRPRFSLASLRLLRSPHRALPARAWLSRNSFCADNAGGWDRTPGAKPALIDQGVRTQTAGRAWAESCAGI